MKTKIDPGNKVKLTPVFTKDKKSGFFKVHYKGFPQAFGKGKTEPEAELNLLQILITLLKERKEKIREQSLNNYYSG
jgi:predicted RNase H-like HicB family nuclease